MRRFFVPPEQCRDEGLTLPEREARHATQVLRLEVGDELQVLDGAGSVLICRLESATKRSVQLRTVSRERRAPLPCAITLVQAIPKGPAFETIVQKATELGVARIIPLLSERVVAHVHESDATAKVEKWRQIAIESIKQCGSPFLPHIDAPIRFDALLERLSQPTPEFAVVCSLQEPHRTMREAVNDFISAHSRKPAHCHLWIGPEGDFTAGEYAAIAKSGAHPISLGPLVLRADTAAIASLAIANHELQSPLPA
jgi:16S rRNA (uracil1498-N3)-methyltransferase